jgi:predicted nucleic acid-binding protein
VVIVDSTVWIDFFNGVDTPETDWLDRELSEQRLGVLDLIVCEVLQGVSSDQEADEVLEELRRLEIFDTGGVVLASAAARNYRALRSRGRTVRKTIDCLIATFCIDGGYELLHCDRDFDPFEEHLGLRVVHPQERET